MASAVEVISGQGVQNAASIVRAAKAVGLEVAIAAAIIQKEGHGVNQYGHDAGGVFSSRALGKPADNLVTEENYNTFIVRVRAGEISNGVGPAQITWAGSIRNGRRDGGFFREMEEQGLKPWEPYDNIFFGLRMFAGYLRNSGDIVASGEAYNGNRSYGVALAGMVTAWRRLLEGASLDVDEPFLGALTDAERDAYARLWGARA